MFSEQYRELEKCLRAEGLQAGLKFLNSRVEHRFTAIYRLEDLMLFNVGLVDKVTDNFDISVFQKVPLQDSFCELVMRNGPIKTSLTTDDERFDGYGNQGVIESYVGLPVMKNSGEMFGTLCHFDFAIKPISDGEFEFLQKVARLLPRFITA